MIYLCLYESRESELPVPAGMQIMRVLAGRDTAEPHRALTPSGLCRGAVRSSEQSPFSKERVKYPELLWAGLTTRSAEPGSAGQA